MLNGDGVDNLNFNMDYFINRVKNSVFVRNVSLTIGTKLAIVIVSFFSSIITARYLGPKGRGILVVLMSFVAIGTQFGNFGLHSANTYFVAKKEELLPRIIGNTLWLSLGGGFLISIIMLIVLYFNPKFASGVPFLLIIISIVTIPFGLFFMLGENILIGVHQIKLFNFFEFINRILPFFVITLLLVFFGQKVEAVVVSIAILTILLTILLFERLRALTVKKISFDFFLLKEMLAYGIKAYLAALFSFLVIRFDMLMVNYY
ncbi:MAG: hypothetical protein HY776_07730 [Actinobacteria bacterium]|nr:hypothetical protein [Actinomycetota bacterium]